MLSELFRNIYQKIFGQKELCDIQETIQKITVNTVRSRSKTYGNKGVDESKLIPQDVTKINESWLEARKKYSEKDLIKWRKYMHSWCADGYVRNRGFTHINLVDEAEKFSICASLLYHFTRDLQEKS